MTQGSCLSETLVDDSDWVEFLSVSLSLPKPGLSSRTPGHGRPPRGALMERNKENITQAPGSLLRGALRTPASPQRNYSINSIASTYSEFAVILYFKNTKTPFPWISSATHSLGRGISFKWDLIGV